MISWTVKSFLIKNYSCHPVVYAREFWGTSYQLSHLCLLKIKECSPLVYDITARKEKMTSRLICCLVCTVPTTGGVNFCRYECPENEGEQTKQKTLDLCLYVQCGGWGLPTLFVA